MISNALWDSFLHSSHMRSLRQMLSVSTFLTKKPRTLQEIFEVIVAPEPLSQDILDAMCSAEKALKQQMSSLLLHIPRSFIVTRPSKMLLFIHVCLAMYLGPRDEYTNILIESALCWLQETQQVSLEKEMQYLRAIEPSHLALPKPELPQPRRRQELRGGGGSEIFEFCRFCDEPLGWTDDLDAQCANGHVFGRFIVPCFSSMRQRNSVVLTITPQVVVL